MKLYEFNFQMVHSFSFKRYTKFRALHYKHNNYC